MDVSSLVKLQLRYAGPYFLPGLVALLVATPETVTVPKLDPKTDETLPLLRTSASDACAAAAAALSEPVKAYKFVTLMEDATTEVIETLQTAFSVFRMLASRVLTNCSSDIESNIFVLACAQYNKVLLKTAGK